MKTINVKSDGRRPFQILDNNRVVAELNYPKWYKTSRAEIQINEEKSLIKTNGLWMNHIELWNQNKCIAQSKLTWNCSVIINIEEKEYFLKVKSLLKGTFVLLDKKSRELISLTTEIDWLYGKAAYEVRFNEDLPTVFSPELVLFLIHNCNYFMAFSGNGGATEALAGIA